MRVLLLALVALLGLASALKDGECEVCLSALKEIEKRVGPNKKDLLKTEDVIDKFCEKPPTVSTKDEVPVLVLLVPSNTVAITRPRVVKCRRWRYFAHFHSLFSHHAYYIEKFCCPAIARAG